MKLLNLYIENFMCYEKTQLDLSNLTSAIIIGQIDGSDSFSNGVGKSTLFKAIEYVLFNECRVSTLEKLIRDESEFCKVGLDFEIDNKIYRIVRKRTIKEISDLSLYERTEVKSDLATSFELSKDNEKLLWNNQSSRRTGDTELSLKKIIKVNYKSFTSAFYFAQNDLSGLPTLTPAKRKNLLKESLDLVIYNKLEKLAKHKSDEFLKKLQEKRILRNSLGNPNSDIVNANDTKNKVSLLIKNQQQVLLDKNKITNDYNNQYTAAISEYKILENSIESSSKQKNDLLKKIEKNKNSINDITTKRKSILNAANVLAAQVKEDKQIELSLQEIDFSILNSLVEKESSLKDKINQNNAFIKHTQDFLIDLKIPLPKESVCKHCRQLLTEEHRKICQNEIDNEVVIKESLIKDKNKENNEYFLLIKENQKQYAELSNKKNQLTQISNKIIATTKELKDKQTLFTEYNNLLSSNKSDLEILTKELESLNNEFLESEQVKLAIIKEKINKIKTEKSLAEKELEQVRNIIDGYNSELAVLDHTIASKNKDIITIKSLENEISILEEKHKIFPEVINAFGSNGIPNLIVQNILNDLQVEANNILFKIKPGLQLSFSIQAVKKDVETDDGMEINYFLNNKPRDYNQLSGAMMLAVTFSLKLALAFVMQKMLGVNVKFLLLDEIDASLDRAGVDAFVEIIKMFHNDFTILIITHNDNLKPRFNNFILVNQNRAMVSEAKVIRS